MTVHPATNIAIEKFGEVLRAERNLDKKKQELLIALIDCPDKDKAYYVSETEAMRTSDQEIRDRNHLPVGS